MRNYPSDYRRRPNGSSAGGKISVLCSKEELAQIRTRAQDLGIGMSRYLLELALDDIEQAQEPTDEA